MKKGLTTKEKQDMQELSKKNNSLRFFRVNCIWYEKTKTVIVPDRIYLKPSYKGLEYITDKDYQQLIK